MQALALILTIFIMTIVSNAAVSAQDFVFEIVNSQSQDESILKLQKNINKQAKKGKGSKEYKKKMELSHKVQDQRFEAEQTVLGEQEILPISLNEELSDSEREDFKKLSDIDQKRAELKQNEQIALDFIFPSTESEHELKATEEFFSQTEKEQLLELWRATLIRNRTIQFIIKALTPNPDDIEKNNAVMQTLSKAIFVPFYAVSAIADNALINGGSAVGARVVGDVVNNVNGSQNRDIQISRTDMIVMFMLVDEVAQRLRSAYYTYKESRIEKELLKHELIPARIDAAEALQEGHKTSIFFTRMVIRDIERQLRNLDLTYRSTRRTLLELSGESAVNSVDLLIGLEIENIMKPVTGI